MIGGDVQFVVVGNWNSHAISRKKDDVRFTGGQAEINETKLLRFGHFESAAALVDKQIAKEQGASVGCRF